MPKRTKIVKKKTQIGKRLAKKVKLQKCQEKLKAEFSEELKKLETLVRNLNTRTRKQLGSRIVDYSHDYHQFKIFLERKVREYENQAEGKAKHILYAMNARMEEFNIEIGKFTTKEQNLIIMKESLRRALSYLIDRLEENYSGHQTLDKAYKDKALIKEDPLLDAFEKDLFSDIRRF